MHRPPAGARSRDFAFRFGESKRMTVWPGFSLKRYAAPHRRHEGGVRGGVKAGMVASDVRPVDT
ncbi:hypothetical protein B7G54_31135 [Burkholderia puraquae]|uniref:Uncharacterized protein n=2 Tax=Burkholderia puraquae TaxID=1904757 RepID=A0A1X1P8H5_9BURK|nr:hypothetical protein B7G54_31135 [Burkholderia puraquae]